jgi:hypothetical protein
MVEAQTVARFVATGRCLFFALHKEAARCEANNQKRLARRLGRDPENPFNTLS